MLKKYLIVPVILVFISIAFILISFFVFVTKGNPKLIKRKLQIGAIIIAMTSALSSRCGRVVTCYEPMPQERVYVYNDVSSDNIYDSIIKVDLNDLTQDLVITGEVRYRMSEYFSYRLIDSNNKTIMIDDIQPFDSKMDTRNEKFVINLNKSIFKSGKYFLYLFNYKKEDQQYDPVNDYIYFIEKYTIEVK